MGDKSGIEWTDATWNPVTGCTKVSQGCKHCYAERVFPRVYGRNTVTTNVPRGSGTRPRRFTDVWTHEDRLDQPLRWKRPRRVFVNSMSDLFHEDVPFDFIDQVFAVMALSPQHTFQVLTKRPARMREYLSNTAREMLVRNEMEQDGDVFRRAHAAWLEVPANMRWWPIRNVSVGVSVEDQETANERIPLLLETPAAVRWVSYEPALGPVDFDEACMPVCTHEDSYTEWDTGALVCHRCDEGGQVEEIDWIVVGGESGPGARPFDVQWARDTVAQCQAAGVPVFVKQLGRKPIGLRPHCDRCNWQISRGRHGLDCNRSPVVSDRKGGDMDEWPPDLRVREYPEAAK